ncbi:MAG: FeoA family protein [Buchananella hordeovulneris]|nr:FeoA family protein [Buchananella hordeovulneris]
MAEMEPPAELPKGALISLDKVPRGCWATIVSIETGLSMHLSQRLLDLGLVPGMKVQLVSPAAYGGPAVIRVASYDVCLRTADAAAIKVRAA